MTLEIFLFLLMFASVVTGLVTEGVKKMLEEAKKTYRANLLAGVAAVFVSVLSGMGYVILADIQIDDKMIVYLVALVLMSWLSAMVGYDKVVQAIIQMKNCKGE